MNEPGETVDWMLAIDDMENDRRSDQIKAANEKARVGRRGR